MVGLYSALDSGLGKDTASVKVLLPNALKYLSKIVCETLQSSMFVFQVNEGDLQKFTV